MRIRQVKPAFWGDARLASLPAATRLFYVGLWMVADDAGWLRWDVAEVARDLYGYEPRTRRERAAAAMFAELVGIERVISFECGHAFIPRLTEHQHLAGSTKQVRTFEKEHRRCLPPDPAGTRDNPQVPALVRLGNGDGQVSQGTVSQGQVEGASDFKSKVGWKP